ncbi:MAG: hypothetical protein M1358_07225 [Chloroflexi bacterium]|nr:hypothetical protein [Chloroflexota bacterium]
MAEGFLDIPRVPAVTPWELRTLVTDQQRRLAALQRSMATMRAAQDLADRTEPNGKIGGNKVSASRTADIEATVWAMLPSYLEAGSQATVTLALTNRENGDGKADNKWFARHRWLDELGEQVVFDGSLPIVVEVPKGRTTLIESRLATPGQPGVYRLQYWLAKCQKSDGPGSESPMCSQKIQVIRQYAAEYSSVVPEMLVVGDRTKVIVVVSNVGSCSWLPNSQIQLSYHWYDSTGSAAVIWEGLRTPLAERVAYGESATVEAAIQAPRFPGEYVLALDLVCEGRTWFSHAGVREFRARVKVVSRAEDAEQTGAGRNGSLNVSSEPVIALGQKLDPDLVALLQAKERRIVELDKTLESMQAMRGLVQQQNRQLTELQSKLNSRDRELDDLRRLLRAIEQGKVLRLLSKLQLLRNRLRL